MEVSIELFGIFRDIANTGKISMPVNGKTSVGDALKYVRRKYPELPLDGDSFFISLNHEMVFPDKFLQPNDVICFIPHIGGG